MEQMHAQEKDHLLLHHPLQLLCLLLPLALYLHHLQVQHLLLHLFPLLPQLQVKKILCFNI